jgi:hypothetical protein
LSKNVLVELAYCFRDDEENFNRGTSSELFAIQALPVRLEYLSSGQEQKEELIEKLYVSV